MQNNYRYLFLAQSQPSPQPTPNVLPNTGYEFMWIAIAAMGGFIANRVWPEWWTHQKEREQSEDKITLTLIDNLSQNNERLLQGNLSGFEALRESQESVHKAIVDLGKTIEIQVQSTLKQQGIGYAQHERNLTELTFMMKALHDRLDAHELTWKQLGLYLAGECRIKPATPAIETENT